MSSLLRSDPDPAVSSASPAPTAAELRELDRQTGWIVVNRWTRPLLRLATQLSPPRGDLSGVERTERPEVGQGVNLVTPPERRGPGAVLLFHGGGHVIGTPKDALATAAALARGSGVPVVCPAYRLSPEHPFPAALDDGTAALHWLLSGAGELDIDPDRVVIAGVSAGGTLAAALCQRLLDEGGPEPAAQLLMFPMLDDRTATRTELDAVRHRVWNNTSNRFGWTSYLGCAPGSAVPPHAVPAHRESLAGLPPAWIGVGVADLFLDENRDYARRLEQAGVEVDYVEVDGAIHGFTNAEQAERTVAFYASAVRFLTRFVS
jgi:acetyl esterase/lipase